MGLRTLSAVAAITAWCALATGCSGSAPTGARPASDPIEAGISYGGVLSSDAPSQLNKALNDAVYVGARWIRVDLSWDVAESSPGVYSWANFARVVFAARARNLSVLAVLAYTPSFERVAGCNTNKCEPANTATFARFAAAAVRHFAPMGVHTWEIWNEENSSMFWQPKPDPSRYAALVRATASAIRSEQPAATIVLGSLAAGQLTGYGTPATTYLQKLCAYRANRSVDAIGWHPYSYPTLPSSSIRQNPWNVISVDKPSFESILAGAGTPRLPVWITEYGAPTNGPGPPAGSPKHPVGVFPTHVTENYQARLARDAVAAAERNLYVVSLFWYTDDDTPSTTNERGDSFGLRRVDGTAKPALESLRRAILALPG